MGFKITWTTQALTSFQQNIEYLQENWSEKEVYNFTDKVNRILKTISGHPEIFPASNRFKDIRRAVIVKQITLVYLVKTQTREIELLNFWGNRRSPKKDKYK